MSRHPAPVTYGRLRNSRIGNRCADVIESRNVGIAQTKSIIRLRKMKGPIQVDVVSGAEYR